MIRRDEAFKLQEEYVQWRLSQGLPEFSNMYGVCIEDFGPVPISAYPPQSPEEFDPGFGVTPEYSEWTGLVQELLR